MAKTYDDGEERPGKVSRVMKGAAMMLIVAVFGILFFRMCTDGATGTVRQFLWNSEAVEAYYGYGGTFGVIEGEDSHTLVLEDVRKLPFPVFSQKPENALDEVETEAGNRFAFEISYLYYVPTLGQIQFTVRHNRSMLATLQSEFALPDPPADEPLVFALKDQNGNLLTVYDYTTGTRNVNHYRRVLFDGVDFSKATTLTLCVYYAGAVDYAAPLYTVVVYDTALPSEPYDPGTPDGVSEMLSSTAIPITKIASADSADD